MTSRKFILIFFIFLGGYLSSKAQGSTHFLYIQSDRDQPFYVRVAGQLLSSSTAGYLIVPGISSGELSLVIGFPKNEYPEQQFSVTLSSERDRGFLLKQTADNHFTLYDLIDFSMLQGIATAPPVPVPAPVPAPPVTVQHTTEIPSDKNKIADQPAVTDSTAPSTDTRFRNLLSAVTNQHLPDEQLGADSSRTHAPAEAMDSSQQASSHPAADTVNSSRTGIPSDSTGSVTVTAATDSTAAATDAQAILSKQPPLSDTETMANSRDLSQAPPSTGRDQQRVQPQGTATDSLTAGRSPDQNHAAYHPQFIDFGSTTPVNRDSMAGAIKKPAAASSHTRAVENQDSISRLTMINSDCTNLIKDEKFIKIRRKIALESTPDQMLDLASRLFVEGCFTVEQVQSLVFLFNTDQYRYKLLDMAYPHVYDSDHFSRLERSLSDPYYIGRFRAMLIR
jgi:hypothetical protein